MINLHCWFFGHEWEMEDGSTPTHGYNNEPYEGAICSRCRKVVGDSWT